LRRWVPLLMETHVGPHRYIRFGPFQVDQHRQKVLRDGIALKLQGKAYQILLTLISKPRQVLTREELAGAAWALGAQVDSDTNLNTTVSKLRQALGDSAERPLYIETIPRKGYSFLMQPEFSVEPFAPLATAHSNGNSVDSSTPENSMATQNSRRWLILGVIALILVGMLIGAGLAIFWVSHFAPRHPAARDVSVSLGHPGAGAEKSCTRQCTFMRDRGFARERS
jgi:DNA-binding winged helix-turn-helix (wHTH) protein